MTDYPEHERMAQVSAQSQVIGEFIDLGPYQLGEYVTYEGHERETFVPVMKSIQQVLADYFEIDLKKIEEEKRAMLAALSDPRPKVIYGHPHSQYVATCEWPYGNGRKCKNRYTYRVEPEPKTGDELPETRCHIHRKEMS